MPLEAGTCPARSFITALGDRCCTARSSAGRRGGSACGEHCFERLSTSLLQRVRSCPSRSKVRCRGCEQGGVQLPPFQSCLLFSAPGPVSCSATDRAASEAYVEVGKEGTLDTMMAGETRVAAAADRSLVVRDAAHVSVPARRAPPGSAGRWQPARRGPRSASLAPGRLRHTRSAACVTLPSRGPPAPAGKKAAGKRNAADKPAKEPAKKAKKDGKKETSPQAEAQLDPKQEAAEAPAAAAAAAEADVEMKDAATGVVGSGRQAAQVRMAGVKRVGGTQAGGRGRCRRVSGRAGGWRHTPPVSEESWAWRAPGHTAPPWQRPPPDA